MGDESVTLEGVEPAENEQALIDGASAGRAMGRSQSGAAPGDEGMSS